MKKRLTAAAAALSMSLMLSTNLHARESVDEGAIATPEAALQALKDGNERFLSGNTLDQDFAAQIAATAGGQAPFAGVLSCLDSRVPPEIVFDQGIGDIFVGRVAGNVEDTKMMGSFEFAGALVNIKLLVVMGHTSCGAVKGACAGAELGNLTYLLDTIQPAVEYVREEYPDGEVCEAPLIDKVAAQNVVQTIEDIRERSPVLLELEEQGQLKIVGAMYDVSTGKVTWL